MALILYNFKLKNLKVLLDCEETTRTMAHYHPLFPNGQINPSFSFSLSIGHPFSKRVKWQVKKGGELLLPAYHVVCLDGWHWLGLNEFNHREVYLLALTNDNVTCLVAKHET